MLMHENIVKKKKYSGESNYKLKKLLFINF